MHALRHKTFGRKAATLPSNAFNFTIIFVQEDKWEKLFLFWLDFYHAKIRKVSRFNCLLIKCWQYLYHFIPFMHKK